MTLELEIRRDGSLGSVTRLTISEAQASSIIAIAKTDDLTYGEVLKFLADRRAALNIAALTPEPDLDKGECGMGDACWLTVIRPGFFAVDPTPGQHPDRKAALDCQKRARLTDEDIDDHDTGAGDSVEGHTVAEHELSRDENDPQGYGDGTSAVYTCTCGVEIDAMDIEGAFDHGRETSGPPDARPDSYAQVFSDTWNANLTVGLRPMVIAWIEGGIGYTAVVRGEVDVLEWDWDNIKEAEEPERIEAYIEEAEQLPDDWPEKADILANMHEALDELNRALSK